MSKRVRKSNVIEDFYLKSVPLVAQINSSLCNVRRTNRLRKMDVPASVSDADGPNQDLLYASAILDLSEGPVFLTIPAADRYLSCGIETFLGRTVTHIQGTSEYQYIRITNSTAEKETHIHCDHAYTLFIARIFCNPFDPEDLQKAKEVLQALQIKGDEKQRPFEVSNVNCYQFPLDFDHYEQRLKSIWEICPGSESELELKSFRKMHSNAAISSALLSTMAKITTEMTNAPHGWRRFSKDDEFIRGDPILSRACIGKHSAQVSDSAEIQFYLATNDMFKRPYLGVDNWKFVIPQHTFCRAWSITVYDENSKLPDLSSRWCVGSHNTPTARKYFRDFEIYASVLQPEGVPKENWLPVIPGKVSFLLRLYAPKYVDFGPTNPFQ